MTDANIVEELTTKVSNLENDIATLSGENDRLTTALKTKDETINEMKQTQK